MEIHRKLIILTYDKRVVTWAMGRGNRFMKVEVLYEMLLRASPGLRDVRSMGIGCKGGRVVLCEVPEMARTVYVGGEGSCGLLLLLMLLTLPLRLG